MPGASWNERHCAVSGDRRGKRGPGILATAGLGPPALHLWVVRLWRTSNAPLAEHETEGKVRRRRRGGDPYVPPPRKDVRSSVRNLPGGFFKELR